MCAGGTVLLYVDTVPPDKDEVAHSVDHHPEELEEQCDLDVLDQGMLGRWLVSECPESRLGRCGFNLHSYF